MKATHPTSVTGRSLLLLLAVLGLLVVAPTGTPAAEAAPPAKACADGSGGTWTPGELNVYWFDVEQGDGQLVVGPTGRTLLIDLGETVWNRTSGTNAQRVAGAIQTICGVNGPVALDYVMGSHLHLDHIGYAGNPSDTTAYGNGIYQLLDPDQLGFTVGTLLDRDGGTFVDSDGNGTCEVGTNASPSPDVVWHDAGTTSSTGRRWICWLYGPDGQRDRANIEGHVVTLTNDAPWPAIDLGPGVDAEIVNANAKGVMQADGVTPVSGDHVTEATPPSENDYSIAVRIGFGDYQYATAGDNDGEYSTSSYGYTYNDEEAVLAPMIGDVETMRVNHHGSSHSTSHDYTTTLAPETAVISCGDNSYGHPAANVLDELAAVPNADGVGADVYLTNNPCDPTIGTVPGAFNSDGDIWMHTTGGGAGYVFTYDVGSRSYAAAGAPTTTPAVTVAEARFRGPGGAGDEFVELLNAGSATVDVSGWALQGCAGSSGAASTRATIPAGTSLAAGQRYLVANASYTGTVAPDVTYTTGITDTGGVRLVDATGAVVDGVGSSDGATSQCREGAGITFPTGDDDVSMYRAGDGATDTDDNVADFTGPSASTPQNAAGEGAPPAPTGSVSDVVLNELLADPYQQFTQEWVELYNPTGVDLDISGLYLDDIANGGSAPKAIPAGTVIPAGGLYVMTWSGGYLNNGGDDVRLLSADQATVYDATTYASSANDQSLHRIGDGGAWCTTLSSNVTQGSANPATCP